MNTEKDVYIWEHLTTSVFEEMWKKFHGIFPGILAIQVANASRTVANMCAFGSALR
jgi:hypothetical protein